MRTLIEELPDEIAELEAEFGSDNPYVKDLKRQLAAMKENVGKTAEDVYRMQAVPIQESSNPDPMQGAADLLEAALKETVTQSAAKSEKAQKQ